MNEKILRIAAFVMAVSVYTSCNKNDTPNPTPILTLDSATIMGFKDSTRLRPFTTARIDWYHTKCFLMMILSPM